MRLYIVRHGEAETRANSDAERALTGRGRDAVAEIWQSLRRDGVQVARLMHSPYVRARQTAEVIGEQYPGIRLEACDLITPDDPVMPVIDWLAAQPTLEGCVLVSHMPLVAALTGALSEGVSARVPFSVGTVACLDMEVASVGGGRLIWTRSPG